RDERRRPRPARFPRRQRPGHGAPWRAAEPRQPVHRHPSAELTASRSQRGDRRRTELTMTSSHPLGRIAWPLLLGLLLSLWALPASRAVAADDDATLAAGLQTLVMHADAAAAALGRGDAAGARAAYAQFDDLWFDIEDGVRDRSRDDYRAIERAMDDVKYALRAEPPDVASAQSNLTTLRERVLQFAATLDASAATAGGAPAAPTDDATIAAREGLRPWAPRIDGALDRLGAGDLAGAQAELTAFRDAWPNIEDPIRAASRPHYREIERAMGDAQAALTTQPPDRAEAKAALEHLRAVNAAFLAGAPLPDDGTPAVPAIGNPTPATLLPLLDQAIAALDRGDLPAALAELRTFQEVWLDVETLVMACSRAVYTSTENRAAEATAALNSTPPQPDAARATLVAMRADLVPGFEALLVIAALVTFLQRSGNADKRGWIWGGGAAGIAASLVVAATAQVVLSRAAANVGREAIEGFTGILAA